jgi:hypothetical protein
MHSRKSFLAEIVWGILLVAAWAGVVLPVAAQQAAIPDKSKTVASASQPQPLETPNHGEDLKPLPDSPGTVASKPQIPIQQASAAPPEWGVASAGFQSAPSQSAPSQSEPQSQSPPQKPSGTAAAEAPHATGIAASQPAGVAIAPAKQRRVRTIVLRVGAIVGAGVAVGTVVALTAATSSRPPGAH